MKPTIATIPIYSSLPLTPDTRAALQATLRGEMRPANLPATVQMHWVVSVVEGIRCLTNQPNVDAATRFEQIMRVKQIQYEGRTAYLLKAGCARSRVILYSHADRIYAVFANLAEPNTKRPHVPLYEQVDSGTYQMQQSSSLARLASDCANFLGSESVYSGAYETIPLTTNPSTNDHFRYGEIVGVASDGDYWRMQVTMRTGNTISVCVKKAYIRYANIKPGYHLVWKDEPEIVLADVASFNELAAFYTENGRTPYGGKHPAFHKG